MVYVVATPIEHTTGKSAVMENGLINRHIFECKNVQEALNLEINLIVEDKMGYIKHYGTYPSFKKHYNIIDETRLSRPKLYTNVEDMDLTDIY